MITKPSLDSKPTAGVVGTPTYQDATTLISTKSADMTNSDTDLNITASNENLSAKFKYPRVSEDVPAAGRNQYE